MASKECDDYGKKAKEWVGAAKECDRIENRSPADPDDLAVPDERPRAKNIAVPDGRPHGEKSRFPTDDLARKTSWFPTDDLARKTLRFPTDDLARKRGAIFDLAMRRRPLNCHVTVTRGAR